MIGRALLGLTLAAGTARADETALHSTIGWGNTVEPAVVAVSTQGGYDGVQQRVLATGLVEVALDSRLSVFAAVTFGEEAGGATRPAVGLAVQLVDPRRAPVGLRLSSAYKPEGFAEPEGEVEAVLTAAHLFERNVARAVVAYGRDLEGNESDVELGVGYLQRVTPNLVVGASSRYRYAIARRDTATRWDVIGGAVGDVELERWRVELLVGGGAVGAAKTAFGPLGLVSVGFDL